MCDMTRIISVLMAIVLMFGLCACGQDGATGDSSSLTADATSSEISASSDNTSSDTSSAVSETVLSEPSSSEVIPSKDETSKNDSSKVTSSFVLQNYDVTVGEYTVVDVENARGIDNTKHGFGFGAAKNGKPHEISVNNQKRFDGYENIEALALDTVSTDKRMYLTFDCGYEYKNLTVDILDILKEKNVKVAFFVTLSYIKNNPEKVDRMIKEGHIVGNHSATHPVFPDISRTKMAEELYKVDEYLQKHFNYESDYFRFPTGAYSENALELVTSVGYKSIFWSVAHGDYDTANQPSVQKTFDTVTGRYHPGAVILLHASSQSNVDALSDMIDEAHTQGYTFKSLDDYYAQ